VLATSPHIIKEIVARDRGMRRFTQKWVFHELTPANRVKQVEDARALLQALRSDLEKNFAYIMTGDESWFCYGYESPTMLGHGRNEVIPRTLQTIGLKRAMIMIFYWHSTDEACTFIARAEMR
jgi:hypothetical protein